MPVIGRREVLRRGCLAGVAAGGWGVPAAVTAQDALPSVRWGVQSGDVEADRGMVWSRTDRPARLLVEWSLSDAFTDVHRLAPVAALESSGFTARMDLRELPADTRIFYRIRFQDLADLRRLSEPVTGSFRTAPDPRRVRAGRGVSFAWSGDMVGQGWGINSEIGGARIFETMRRAEPDFFLHSGDCIYADNPLQPEVRLEDGRVWKNLMTPEKAKVAETLAEFRGCYAYNLLDENVRRFNARIPIAAQWDDHETCNNWYPGRTMDGDPRYQVKSCDLLAARARRAFLDYLPLRYDPLDPERIYRSFRWGPHVEVFLLDERSYRGPNTGNRQPESSPDTAFLGSTQVQWLKARLRASRATWKVIASDMPIGLMVGDTGGRYEAVANGNGPALGRELEIADLLRYVHHNRIRNLVWVTADVHYCAAHYYDPNRAKFQEFTPFWEFVAGPLNAGTFGPGVLDDTFGPQARFVGIPAGMRPNRPPTDGFQFFGMGRVDPGTRALTISLHNAAGSELFRVDLDAEGNP